MVPSWFTIAAWPAPEGPKVKIPARDANTGVVAVLESTPLYSN